VRLKVFSYTLSVETNLSLKLTKMKTKLMMLVLVLQADINCLDVSAHSEYLVVLL